MKYALAIVPSAGVLFLFWLAVRAMITADRRERAAHARMGGDTAPAPKGSNPGGSGTRPNG
jgi:hypothetical protein